MNYFNNNERVIIPADINVDKSYSSKLCLNGYLDVLTSVGLENTINEYTREERIRSKITKSCIDHAKARLANIRHIPGVIKENVADHYLVCTKIV